MTYKHKPFWARADTFTTTQCPGETVMSVPVHKHSCLIGVSGLLIPVINSGGTQHATRSKHC